MNTYIQMCAHTDSQIQIHGCVIIEDCGFKLEQYKEFCPSVLAGSVNQKQNFFLMVQNNH